MATKDKKRPTRPLSKFKLSTLFQWLNWGFQWIEYRASNSAFFGVLEYAGRLTILFAIVLWIMEIPERRRQNIRSTWEILNEKGGGRLEALKSLYKNGVDLRGMNCSKGYFEGVDLHGADLSWADLSEADFNGANLSDVKFQGANLNGTSFFKANFKGADLSSENFVNTKFESANLAGVNCQGSAIGNTNFKNADLKNTNFQGSKNWGESFFDNADISGADFRKMSPMFDTLDNVIYKNLESAKNYEKALIDKKFKK